jgi:SAM-dependent methyltransferase
VSSVFNKDYYEDGISSGVSCYENYRWLPEMTIPAVMSYIDYLEIPRKAKVLDFGCAKGYYVKAFRLLHRDAWGCDISEYAIKSSDAEVFDYLKVCGDEVVPFNTSFDFVVAKDVLEHLDEECINLLLYKLSIMGVNTFFVSVPLADDCGKYIIPNAEKDITHKIRGTADYWIRVFTMDYYWKLERFSYSVDGLKNYQEKYKNGVGFFTLKNSFA